MNKQKWLDLAEILDAYRIIPRLILVFLYIAYLWFSIDTYMWVKHIYEITKTIPNSVAAFSAATMSALGTVIGIVTNKYFDSGRKWIKTKTEKEDE